MPSKPDKNSIKTTPNNYEQQLLIRKQNLERAKQEREERADRELDGCTFAPRIFTVPQSNKNNATVMDDKYIENSFEIALELSCLISFVSQLEFSSKSIKISFGALLFDFLCF